MTDTQRIALYGAGHAAILYTELFSSQVTCYTTDGEGSFQGQSVTPISELRHEAFAQIVIASDYFHEMLMLLVSEGVPLEKIVVFDYEADKLVPARSLMSLNKANSLLHVFYDLAINHPNYDILHFLIKAEQYRAQHGYSGFHLVVVPSNLTSGATAKAVNRYQNDNEVSWRIERLVSSAAQLVPACQGVTVLAQRSEVQRFLTDSSCFPPDYNPEKPEKVYQFVEVVEAYHRGISPDVFVPPAKAMGYVQEYLNNVSGGRKVLVITMREYNHEPKRNTDYDVWLEFLSWLDKEQYCPIIVRDTAFAYQKFNSPLDDFENCSHAAIDIQFRLALYQSAWFNMTVDCGPCELMLVSESIPYVIYKPLIKEYIACDEDFARDIQGIPIGGQAPWRHENQKYLWQKESFAELKKELLRFAASQE